MYNFIRYMENINLIVFSVSFAGAIFIARYFLLKLPEFKNQGEYFEELYKKQEKLGNFEIKKLAGGLI